MLWREEETENDRGKNWENKVVYDYGIQKLTYCNNNNNSVSGVAWYAVVLFNSL